MKKLRFEITIHAARARVWDTMLEQDTYRMWTAVFAPGSSYEGSWEAGQRIRFGTPDDHSMSAVIAANEPHRFLSIQHESMGSPSGETAVESAFENYTFTDTPEGTRLVVDLDMPEEYESFMTEKWPAALAKLKELCESGARA